MQAIILAAGRGSRMKSLTDERPKCLLELRGRTLLELQSEALRAAGVDEIGLVTGYRSDLLSTQGFLTFHNPRWKETNMVSSLACAEKWLQSGPCVVSYSDIVFGADAVRTLVGADALLAITYDPNWLRLWQRRFTDPLVDAETFRLNGDGTLAEIGRTPRFLAEIQGQYMGLLRFSPQAWKELSRIRSSLPQSAQDAMHMTGALQMMIETGRVPVTALPYVGAWGEVDTEEDLRLLPNIVT